MIWVGTSGYQFDEWKGAFYPDDLPAKKMLAFYAERIGTVEINYTFYRMPTEKGLRQWAEQTPAGFRFALKGSQRITHKNRLKDSAPDVEYFCATARVLGEKLGPILFQLPPFLRKDATLLREFCALLPRDLRFTMEFRHESWLDPEVLGILAEFGVSLTRNDTAGDQPAILEGESFLYARLRQDDYTEADLDTWSQRLQPFRAAGRDAYIYFKHEVKGPEFARALTHKLE
jgi:uncharacterized protein YecE (DUF72 family)